MGAPILGVILIVIGVVTLTYGVAGGIAKMFLEIKRKAATGPRALGSIELPISFLESITKLIEALVKSPRWLALVIIAILLIAWSGYML